MPTSRTSQDDPERKPPEVPPPIEGEPIEIEFSEAIAESIDDDAIEVTEFLEDDSVVMDLVEDVGEIEAASTSAKPTPPVPTPPVPPPPRSNSY